MTGHEHVTAEISRLKRRGLAAAPAQHPLRTPQCPPLGALANGRLSASEANHVANCRHCRSVRIAAEQPRAFAAPAIGAIAAALALGVWLSGSRPLARYEGPTAHPAAPSPRAVEAAWPAPLKLRAPGMRLSIPAENPPLPVIRPLERFHPPERSEPPIPLAALGGPTPPLLEPAPAPDVVGMLGLRAL